jgi:hypothetical protein
MGSQVTDKQFQGKGTLKELRKVIQQIDGHFSPS